jgi:hypothetical protein
VPKDKTKRPELNSSTNHYSTLFNIHNPGQLKIKHITSSENSKLNKTSPKTHDLFYRIEMKRNKIFGNFNFSKLNSNGKEELEKILEGEGFEDVEVMLKRSPDGVGGASFGYTIKDAKTQEEVFIKEDHDAKEDHYLVACAKLAAKIGEYSGYMPQTTTVRDKFKRNITIAKGLQHGNKITETGRKFTLGSKKTSFDTSLTEQVERISNFLSLCDTENSDNHGIVTKKKNNVLAKRFKIVDFNIALFSHVNKVALPKLNNPKIGNDGKKLTSSERKYNLKKPTWDLIIKYAFRDVLKAYAQENGVNLNEQKLAQLENLKLKNSEPNVNPRRIPEIHSLASKFNLDIAEVRGAILDKTPFEDFIKSASHNPLYNDDIIIKLKNMGLNVEDFLEKSKPLGGHSLQELKEEFTRVQQIEEKYTGRNEAINDIFKNSRNPYCIDNVEYLLIYKEKLEKYLAKSNERDERKSHI